LRKYTANYSYSNHNFVIQNLNGQRIRNEYLPAICILKNILQRGKPTLMSKYLQENLGSIHRDKSFENSIALIDSQPQKWNRVIRGDEKGNHFPAKKFFEELIPKYLTEYKFVQQLIIPEIPINEITQVEVNEFVNKQVDFYLPQAYLVIEIDGSQHDPIEDKLRDNHLARFGIETVRIAVNDLEQENHSFIGCVERINKRIGLAIKRQNEQKKQDSTFISFTDYKDAFKNGVDLESPFIKATAIIRFQLLILELLENGLLHFDTPWQFEVIERDVQNFARLAIDDIQIWFEELFKLHKLNYDKPKISIIKVRQKEKFSPECPIKVDFSLKRRYTDEFLENPEIIFVRSHYFDEFRHFKNANSINPEFVRLKPYDFFRISTTDPIKYKLKFGGKRCDEKSLRFLLWNIFLQNDSSLEFETLKFREGQLPIIANALSRNDTLGLLPTGSGKSVCYQLSAILQPAISFVVCPIKSLMYDQKADLDSAYFNRVNHITSDDDGEDKDYIQKEFGLGKYFFIFVSPERFQLKTFRQYFSLVNQEFNIAYAVIDEVHCLSEWGHDFRTSYLNLSNTIQRLCSNFNFLGLTATASINVLKDIQIEFGIKQENVKTPVDYTRKELEFIVLDDKNDKLDVIKSKLDGLQIDIDALQVKGSDTKCGIIFTSTVNGENGCYSLSQKLSEYFNTEIKFYSGSVPKIDGQSLMTEKQFDEYKKNVQDEFKKNKFALLTATKAFGMGVNKGNIHFTFHYGLPSSMESLYQEAGRAGRDKTRFQKSKAQSFVLLTKTANQSVLKKIWDPRTSFSRFLDSAIDSNGQVIKQKLFNSFEKKQLQKEKLSIRKGLISETNGDINTQLFLFSNSVDVIRQEFEVIKKLHTTYSSPNKQNVRVEGSAIGCNKARTEKAIYRLSQLGVIKDWTIHNFFGGGSFEVDFANFSNQTIKESLLYTIRKYDSDFSFESLIAEEKDSIYKRILSAPNSYSEIDKQILILLQWAYDKFAYNRKQSLKNIYENCCDLSDGQITSKEFKLRLENYFKFSQSSYVLQHISENPKDFLRWFEVFYQSDKNTITDEFITKRQQESLRDNLSRFLESYMQNVGLDLISGFLRLLLDDYENSDGRNRLESSLEQISHFEQRDIDFILEQLLEMGNILNTKNKDLLAESLYKHFNTYEYLMLIWKTLRDRFSMATILEISTKKLETINRKIYDKFGKIG
jgi:ATP-dependent DNA helicase RecQ